MQRPVAGRVEHDVVARRALGDVGPLIVDRDVSPEFTDEVVLRGAADRRDPPPVRLGQLDGVGAHAAARAENEHRMAPMHHPTKTLQGRHPGDRDGRSLLERQTLRLADEPIRTCQRILGEGALGGAEDSVTRHELRNSGPDRLHCAGDLATEDGKPGAPQPEAHHPHQIRAPSHQMPDAGVEARCVHPDEHFAGIHLWCWLVAQLHYVDRPVPISYDRFHRRLLRCALPLCLLVVYGVHHRRIRCTAYTRQSMAKTTSEQTPSTPVREPLSRQGVLQTAVALADRDGADGLSMRRLSQVLGVVPMALYKHVASKDEMLDGMIDVVVGEIDAPVTGVGWQAAVRQRILSARRAQLRHRWAARVLESRSAPTATVMAYMDSMVGVLRAGGFSTDLAHHALHALGSRMLGFSQELFDDSASTELAPEMSAMLSTAYPHVYEIAATVMHDDTTVVGGGCDDQFEFEFALDLMLDGLERLRRAEQHCPADMHA